MAASAIGKVLVESSGRQRSEALGSVWGAVADVERLDEFLRWGGVTAAAAFYPFYPQRFYLMHPNHQRWYEKWKISRNI